MFRKITNTLLMWKRQQLHLPLLVYGARQVGKTYIIKKFGEQYYRNVVYVNFEEDNRLGAYLDVSLQSKHLIKSLEDLYGVKILPKETLVFFDEVQCCEKALTALKYIAEESPEYDFIAAGSLLGVKIKREAFSFPVGKVQFANMYPMDFEEFLLAEKKDYLVALIRKAYGENASLPLVLHEEAMLEYKRYLVVGGMPAVVAAYVEGRVYTDIQRFLYTSYVADMTKYAPQSESVKIVEAYDSLPAQLAKENKKFQYKVIKKGGRAALYGAAIDWLLRSGVCLKCSLVEQGLLPFSAYQDPASFKLYYSDMGILGHRTHMDINLLEHPGLRQFAGALTENYVAISLSANGYELNYWTSGATAEVDFVILKDNAIIPVECKAGEHVRSRSLSVFMKKYASPYAIRISARNFGMENQIKSVPLYATFCI